MDGWGPWRACSTSWSRPATSPARRAPAARGLAPTSSDDGTDPTPQSLCTTLDYNHQAGFTTADFQRATGWTVLRKEQYDPTEDDAITCIPLGDGPVVDVDANPSGARRLESRRGRQGTCGPTGPGPTLRRRRPRVRL